MDTNLWAPVFLIQAKVIRAESAFSTLHCQALHRIYLLSAHLPPVPDVCIWWFLAGRTAHPRAAWHFTSFRASSELVEGVDSEAVAGLTESFRPSSWVITLHLLIQSCLAWQT
jgi:hypothetical protein